MQVC